MSSFYAALKSYIEKLFEGCSGFVELRAKDKTGKTDQAFFDLTTLSGLDDFVSKHNGVNRVWYTPQPRYRENGKKEAIDTVISLICDIDLFNKKEKENNPEPDEIEKRQLAFLESIRDFVFQPSIIVDSGSGFHLKWLLREPFKLSEETREQDITRIEKVQRHLLKYFKADQAVSDIGHPLGLPYTVNSRYNPPRLVQIIFDDFKLKYNLSDFETFFQDCEDADDETTEEEDTEPHTSLLSDEEVLERAGKAGNAAKFNSLMAGKWEGLYETQSEADMALCMVLAFWCNRDAEQMDRLFRTSGLYRKKWNQRNGAGTYGSRTIKAAIALCKETYQNQHSQKIEWFEPVFFGEIETPPIETAKILPEGWLRTFVDEVVASTQTPPGMAVMFVLSVVAACTQKRFEVSPYNDDYKEPTNIWTTTVLEVANRKTSVKNELTAPLSLWEIDEFKRLQPEIRRVCNERDVNAKRIDQLKAVAAKPATTDSEREDYLKRIKEIEKDNPEEIHPPRVWSDDTTPERFQMLLAENGERIAVISDEGGIFETMGGLYSDGRVNINVFLQSHAGSRVRVERQIRHCNLEKPASTFGLAVQPEVLSDFSKGSKRRFRGLGALARFLYCVPKSNVGTRKIKKRTKISETAKINYDSGIMALLKIAPIYDESGREIPRILTLSKDALESWEKFSEFIESRLGANGEYYPIQDWCGKLPGAALRIAGNLHVVEYGESSRVINKETIELALDLCELLIPHAQAAFALMGNDEALNDAKHILRWIIEKRDESFSQRDCLKKFEGRFKRVERLKKALEVLSERHIISEPQKRNTMGRPGIYYRVNPLNFEEVK